MESLTMQERTLLEEISKRLRGSWGHLATATRSCLGARRFALEELFASGCARAKSCSAGAARFRWLRADARKKLLYALRCDSSVAPIMM